MAPRRSYRLDNKLTAMMVDDMLFNPILAADVLLGVEDLPPHEELRIGWMWTHYYTNDDSGFSTGKSWTLACVAALRSILMEGRISGILSKTYEQGKLIFQNFDRWYDTNAIFRSCVKHAQGKPRIVHGSGVHQAFFRGGAEVRVLPPNFLNDSERIRSERWNDAYLDEWTTYGNFKALNTTIIGRVTKTNYFPNCPVRQNHIHLASTPAFEHHPAYKMIKMVNRQIAGGNKDYGRFTCNYRHIPDTPEWQWMVNRRVIFHMQTNNPRGVVKAEVDGLWSKDSESYYNSLLIQRSRLNIVPLLTGRTEKGRGEIFICGFDVAPGGGDNKTGGQGDDFSMSVWRMVVGEWIPHHVLTVRKNRISDVAMSGIIHKYHRKFGFSLVVCDPGGGGLFVKEKLRLSKQLIDNTMTACTPIITPTDQSGTIGSPILVLFARGDYYIKQMWEKMASDSVLVNRAHKEFKAAIEHRKALLSGEWNGWEGEHAWDVGAKRDWLNKHPHTDEAEMLKAEMDLAVAQLMSVDVKRDKNGLPLLDKYMMYQFNSKEKKDSAYGLLYGYVGVIIYLWMQESGIADEFGDDKSNVVFDALDISIE